MSKATTTVEGFVANDLEVRDAQGHRVVKVTVPHTPRRLNKQTNQYEDAGETAWFTASFWDDAVDPIVNAVAKKALVTITGQPSPRGYTKQDGTVAVETELKFATLGVIPRAFVSQSAGSAPAPSASSPAVDAWASASPGSFGDDTPF